MEGWRASVVERSRRCRRCPGPRRTPVVVVSPSTFFRSAHPGSRRGGRDKTRRPSRVGGLGSGCPEVEDFSEERGKGSRNRKWVWRGSTLCEKTKGIVDLRC